MRPHERLRSLHGLRGIAVLLVVLFHLFGAGRVSGGIDVFVAISGFLFTGLITRRVLAGNGGFDVPAYLARLVRRLLPPLLPVLVFVLIGTLTWLPTESRVQTWREVAAVLTYRENFELITSQLSYDAAGLQTSPVQHFWSLSVQGQFYLVWPVVILVAYWTARRLRIPPVRVVVVAVAACTVLSFAFAMRLHAADQEVAYLHTVARWWQLSLPGLLALAVGMGVRSHRAPLLNTRARFLLGWLGVALIVTCGFVLDGARLFPGPWALWPVLGLCLFLLAGDVGVRGSADAFLSVPVAGWLADRSYALYVWHWPLLICALHLTGRPPGDALVSVVLLVVSLIAADLTYRFVEAPARDQGRWAGERRTAAAGLVVLVTAAALLLGMAHLEGGRQTRALEGAREGHSLLHPGAAALEPTTRSSLDGDLLVSPALAAGDKPPHDAQGCWQPATDSPEFTEATLCPEPPGEEVPDPVATIIVTGGSHGAMWEPTWRVLVMVKAGCQLTTNVGQHPVSTDVLPTESCQAWNRNALDVISQVDPDVVFTLATTTSGEETEKASTGFVEVFEELDRRGLDVVAIRDLHRMKERVPACLENNPNDPAVCDTPRVPGPSPMSADMVPDNVSLIDLTDAVCTPDYCPAVIGNVVAYFDHSHLSASFSRTLAPALDAELRRVRPDLYRARADAG